MFGGCLTWPNFACARKRLSPDETTFRGGEEVEEVVNLLALRHTLANQLDSFGKETGGIEKDVVGGMEIVDNLNGEAATLETDEVESAECSGMSSYHAEGGDILRATCATAHHDVTSYTTELVNENIGTEDGEVINDDLSGEFRAIANDAAVANKYVVCYVHALHEQVIAANDGTALGGGATVDGDILTNRIVVTHFCRGFFATELEVLGNGTYDGTGEDAVAIADATAVEDSDGVHQDIVVANDDSFVDVAERTNLTVLADASFGMDVC